MLQRLSGESFNKLKPILQKDIIARLSENPTDFQPVLWSEIKMIIDYVNRTKKQNEESASDAIKAGVCAALCIVVFGLLVVML